MHKSPERLVDGLSRYLQSLFVGGKAGNPHRTSPSRERGGLIVKIILGLVAITLIAVVVLPLVIDVNHYRPEIEKAANQRINGKLSIGSIKLNLWGHIKFDVDGLKLEDSQGKVLVQTKSAGVFLPFLNLLSGSPVLKVVLNNPEVLAVKNSKGQLNLLTIVKEDPKGSSASGDNNSDPNAAATKSEPVKLPPLLLASRITLLIEHAKVTYKDETSGIAANIPDLSLHLKDVSPQTVMPFDAKAEIDVKVGPDLQVKGPLSLEGSLKASGPAEHVFSQVDGQASLILDELDIEKNGTFHKTKGVLLRLEGKGKFQESGTDLELVTFRIADVSVQGKAKVQNTGSAEAPISNIDLEMRSNEIDLGRLGGLLPAVGDSGLSGKISLALQAKGPSDHLAYAADMNLKEVNLKTASLKKPVEMNGKIEVRTNELKDLDLRLKSAGLDGTLKLALQNFQKPVLRGSFDAKEVNLDELMVNEKAPERSEKEKGKPKDDQKSNANSSNPKAANEDLNQSLAPLRSNPILAQSSGTVDLNIAKLVSNKILVQKLKGQIVFNNLLIQLKQFGLQVFDGQVKMNSSLNARSALPEVGVDLEAQGLNTQRMAESQMAVAKDSVKGTIGAKMNLGGKGLNRSEINQNWHGGGSFSILNASFSTLDVGKRIRSEVLEKLPAFARSKVKISDRLIDWKGDYKSIQTKFALANGTLRMTDLTGTAVENRGMDLKGSGDLSIVDYKMNFDADFIDKYELMGSQFPKDRRYNAAALSAHVTGTLMDPHFDWGRSVESLAKNAVADTAKEKGKEALKKQLEKTNIQEKLPDAAKGLFKGLFH